MQWQMLTGSGDIYNLNDWIMNYSAWKVLQIRNTTSTDLSFKQDKQAEKLYISLTNHLQLLLNLFQNLKVLMK